jgi:hypothetical protein
MLGQRLYRPVRLGHGLLLGKIKLALAETWSVPIDLLFLMFLDVMEVKWIY